MNGGVFDERATVSWLSIMAFGFACFGCGTSLGAFAMWLAAVR